MIPEKLGRYEVLAPLGNLPGDFLGCLPGRDGFQKLVALTHVLRREELYDELISMFVDEAGVAVGLVHRNVGELLEASGSGGALVLAREFIAGQSLSSLLRQTALPLNIACRVMHDVCLGLHAGHTFGCVHRDVSPKNVLLSYEGEVKVVDFGVAKVINHHPSEHMTMTYWSPEQVRGQRIDARSDLFSVGVLFRELITGANALDEVIAKALAENPDDRHQTCEAFANAIAAASPKRATDAELTSWMHERFPAQRAAARELFEHSKNNAPPSNTALLALAERVTDARMSTVAPKRGLRSLFAKLRM